MSAVGGVFETDLCPGELAAEQARMRTLDELPPIPGDTLEKLQKTPSPFRGFGYRRQDDPVRYQTSYTSEQERLWCETHDLVAHECWDEVKPRLAELRILRRRPEFTFEAKFAVAMFIRAHERASSADERAPVSCEEGDRYLRVLYPDSSIRSLSQLAGRVLVLSSPDAPDALGAAGHPTPIIEIVREQASCENERHDAFAGACRMLTAAMNHEDDVDGFLTPLMDIVPRYVRGLMPSKIAGGAWIDGGTTWVGEVDLGLRSAGIPQRTQLTGPRTWSPYWNLMYAAASTSALLKAAEAWLVPVRAYKEVEWKATARLHDTPHDGTHMITIELASRGEIAHTCAVISRWLEVDPVSEGYLVWLLAILAECYEALGDRAEAHRSYVSLRDAHAKDASRWNRSETAEPYDEEHTRDRGNYLNDYCPPDSAWHESHAGRVPGGLIAERIARCRPIESLGEGHKRRRAVVE